MDRLKRNSTDRWLAVAVGAATFALFLTTLDEPSITWDEGATIRRESLVRGWFARVIAPPQGVSRSEFFEEPAISTFWPFAREEPDGHPPFYAILGNLGWLLTHNWLPPLQAHRFGPVVLFCFTTAVMFQFLARRWSRLAGAAAASAWVLMPRVFAHAHLASYDIPLACLWFLAVVAFWKAREGWSHSFARGLVWSVVFAIMLALAAATKFTGWLIPLPLLVWSIAAGMKKLRTEGKAAARKVSRLVVFLALPIAVAAVELHLVSKLTRVEASLEHELGEDSQHRAARAAAEFRAGNSAVTLRWVPWVNLLAWCGMYGVVGIFHWWIGPRPVNQSEALPERLGERLSVSRESSFRIRGQPAAAQFAPEAEIWTATAALTPALTILLVPTWWSDPWRGIAIFLWSNLTRQRTTWIPTQFFGTLYEFSLPWYNTLAWVFLTVPPLTLLLIVCGTVATIFCRTKMPTAVDEKEILESNPYFARLLLLNAATLLVIRALPGAPGHDGERQLLGSFPFLACLAGFGVECMRNIVQSRWKLTRANTVLRGFAALALVWATFDTWRYRPVQLSYYTELVGGLRGAARIGLEPTYYWDALDHNVIDWLNQHTRPGEKVLFCNYAQDSFRYLDQWGTLRASIWPHEPGVWRWYVLQNRPGLFAEKPWDRWLAEHGRPAFTREQDRVPLLWVFPIEEYEKARRQTEPARQAD